MKLWQRFVVVSFIVAIFLNGLLWLGVWQWLPHTLPDLILHYNVYLGPDVFGPWQKLLFLPAVGLGIISVNGVVAFWWRKQGAFFANMLAGVAVLLQVVLGIGLFFILSINRLVL